MPRRMTVRLLILVLGLGSSAGVSALEAPDLRRVDALLGRLDAAAVDPLELTVEVPPVPESVEDLDTRQSLAIARAIRTLETSVDTTLAILEGDVLTPLSLARNYRHLGMRRRALRWYDGAVTADKDQEYSVTLRREISECTAELGDSALVVEAILQNLRLGPASRVDDHTALLLKELADRPASTELVELVERIEARRGPRSPRLSLAIAQFWQRRTESGRAHAIYREMLRLGEEMDLEVTARVLKGLADTAIDVGDLATGSELYRRFQSHDTGRLSAWSTYRLGQLAVVEGRFADAEKNFRSICERESSTPWQDDACTQLGQTRQLIEIEDALRPFGLSLNMKRGSAR